MNLFMIWYVRIARDFGHCHYESTHKGEVFIMLTLQQLKDGVYRLTLDLTIGKNHVLKTWYFVKVQPSTAEPDPHGEKFRWRIKVD